MAKRPSPAQLDLLAKLQPSYWRTKTERKRFLKGLSTEKRAVEALEKGGWIEEQDGLWVPSEAGYLALMMGEAA